MQFSLKTMQDTETKNFNSFILEGTTNSKYGKQLSIKYLVHVLFTIENVSFSFCSLKNFSLKNFVNSNFQRALKSSKSVFKCPKKLVFLVWMTFLLIIMT